MPATSNTTSPNASSEHRLPLPGGEVPLVVRRVARARRWRLAIQPDGRVRLSVPARGPLAPALAWAAQQHRWIEATLAARPGALPLAVDAAIPFDGTPHHIRWHAGGRGVEVRAGALWVGGPAELVPGRLLRWLRAEAGRRLAAETRDMAAAHGISVGRIGIGDPRGRWGSCSGAGDIRYSWRLLLAPPAVRRAVVAHELAHRRHMDHSPAFHAAVAALLGHSPAAEREWLRRHGPALHAVARS